MSAKMQGCLRKAGYVFCYQDVCLNNDMRFGSFWRLLCFRQPEGWRDSSRGVRHCSGWMWSGRPQRSVRRHIDNIRVIADGRSWVVSSYWRSLYVYLIFSQFRSLHIPQLGKVPRGQGLNTIWSLLEKNKLNSQGACKIKVGFGSDSPHAGACGHCWDTPSNGESLKNEQSVTW